MSNDGKAGLNASGSQDSSSNRKYTPMSQRFTGSNGDAYRWTDSDGFERFPREQPMGSLVDAVIAALKQIKADNPTSVPAHSRDHIALVIFAQNYKTITSNPSSASNPFTYDYDACMLLASQLQAECQDMGASTNTNGGLSQALSSLNTYSRNYANRVTVLFTDGVPNSGSTPSPLSSSQMVDMDGDGTLDTNYYYSNTTANKYKNAALVAAQQLANARTVVHTVCAGGGRDTDITKRMSVLSRGIYRDSGSNLHEYASNLINDIKDLTNAKVPKMTLLGPSDTETN
ncbi:MAG: vWA domain-containing protein [Planctomycetota bacterium]